MNYEYPLLLQSLAAEHVLGTLRGAARRRFERLCVRSDAARGALHRWEEDWADLSLSLTPLTPSARVWAGLEQRLFAAGRAAPRVRRWRAWPLAAAAGLVAVAFIVGLIMHQRPAPLETLAVLGPDTTHPVWRIERRAPLTALTIRVVGAAQPPEGKSYELWALPRGGSPVSLGLLPAAGTYERSLSAAQRAALLASDKVAVSVEPAGGSPTGSPTGPVIIVSSLPALG
jgi:anti-sigma-K factor RskA